MDDFDWTDLAHKGSQGRHVVIVCKLANVNLERIHIEEGHPDLVLVLLDWEDVLAGVSLVLVCLVGAFGHHIADSSSATLIAFVELCLPILFPLFLPIFEHSWCLNLLNYRHLETMVCQYL